MDPLTAMQAFDFYILQEFVAILNVSLSPTSLDTLDSIRHCIYLTFFLYSVSYMQVSLGFTLRSQCIGTESHCN